MNKLYIEEMRRYAENKCLSIKIYIGSYLALAFVLKKAIKIYVLDRNTSTILDKIKIKRKYGKIILPLPYTENDIYNLIMDEIYETLS